MRRRAALGTLAALVSGAAIVGYAASARSTGPQEGPAAAADPPADITGAYAWMDGTNVVLAMTAYPDAPDGAQLSSGVQYVWHTASVSAFSASADAGAPVPVDVIATFDASQDIQLWVGTTEYVTGNASQTAGLASPDGLVKVFAGPRADPFFFNLDGFEQTALDIQAASQSFILDEAGCPALGSTAALLTTQLASAPDGGAPVNRFATFNGLAIVVSIARSLLTKGGPILSVWAGTYATGPIGDAGGQ